MSAHERDYLGRTIATVRNHRGAENCWPQWANIFADEIERLWAREAALAEAYRKLHAQACDDWWADDECACGGRQLLAVTT